MPELRVQTGCQKNQIFLIRQPGPVLIGRDMSADFPMFDRRASRKHFRMEFRDEGYRITDLGSRSGTLVNDRRIESAIVAPGDRVLAGKTLFVFEFDPPADPLVGREIGGYRILERVGRGGMGIVYRARQASLERVIALKVLEEHLTRDEDFCKLFIREARAAGELSHPNIVRVYDVNMADGILFYAMEYMAQGTVEDLCRLRGILPVMETVRIALQACQGLEFSHHEGIIHRDIKPSNLLIHEDGTVKIGDLGIATHDRGANRSPLLRGIMGSPHYMAPEQVLGREADSRADVYALGSTIFRLLAGRPPFRGTNVKEILLAHVRTEPPDLAQLRPEAFPALAQLVNTMLAKDPAGRPPTMQAVIEKLEGVLSRAPDHHIVPRGAPILPPHWSRRAFLLGALVVAFVVGVGIGGFLADLLRKIKNRKARLARIRRILRDGHKFLDAGNIEAARLKKQELASFQGSPDDWESMQQEISDFEKRLKHAEGKLKKDGGLH